MSFDRQNHAGGRARCGCRGAAAVLCVLGMLMFAGPAAMAGQQDGGVPGEHDSQAVPNPQKRIPDLSQPPREPQANIADLRKRVEAILAHYRTGAEEGDPAAMYILAHGLLLTGEQMEGIRWMEKAASRREPRALAAMGQFHQYGDFGVTQNYELAADLYAAAAEQGDPDGLFGLAFLYELGRGVPWDIDKAEALYESAAKKGHGLSQFTLARMHILGKVEHPDYISSYKWLKILTEQADIDAQLKSRANSYLSRVKEVMQPAQIIEGEAAAKAWLQRTKPPARKPKGLVIP